MAGRQQPRIQKSLMFYGFGFPIELRDVPFRKVLGEWIPAIDYDALSRAFLAVLPRKPVRLSGDEVRFIRLTMGLTLEEFGRRFDVSHPAVKKWESSGDKPTNMRWAAEKDVRLAALDYVHVNAREFVKAYERFVTAPPRATHHQPSVQLGAILDASRRDQVSDEAWA